MNSRSMYPRVSLIACLLVAFGVLPMSVGADEPAAASAASGPGVTVERVTAAVPWPRGVRWVDGKLYAIGRGVHRSAGGPQSDIDDHAGHLFLIDPSVAEPAVPDTPVGDALRSNATVLAKPTSPPFRLWNREMPATGDRYTDRPYCQLVYDAQSRNFFLCGYSGIDLPVAPKFRKNATDSIHRYDLRDGKWHAVEAHDPDVVPAEEQKAVVAPRYYPHHDPATNPPPHGLVNGPCGAIVVGDYLYVGAKDNTALARYDLRPIREDPAAGPPPGRLAFHRSGPDDDVHLEVEGHGSMYVEGTAPLAAHDGWLYIAFRTTSQILRFPLREDGALVEPLVGQYIAQFPRYDPEKGGGSANIYDMAFDEDGLLYVSPGYDGAIYRFKPDPDELYDATGAYPQPPFVDLTERVGARRSGNICFDDEGWLYVCSGQDVLPDGKIRGVIYRVRTR